MKRLWWLVLLQGIGLLVLGIIAIFWPQITLLVLSYTFAAYIITAGILNIIQGTASRRRRVRYINLFLGVIQVGVGAYIFSNPNLALATFILVIGLSFLGQGALEIAIAIIERDKGIKVLAVAAGILAILAGLFMLRYPLEGGVAFAGIVGVYGLLAGAVTIASALTLSPGKKLSW